MKLSDLPPGKTATVLSIDPKSPLFYRFIDIGIIPSFPISCLFKSLFGGIKAYSVSSKAFAIRKEDAQYINVIL